MVGKGSEEGGNPPVPETPGLQSLFEDIDQPVYRMAVFRIFPALRGIP